MKVYIAGPMSGVPDFNFPAFHSAAKFLAAAGYDVVNPADLDGGDTSKPWNYYLKRDLPLLAGCDAIALLPKWEKSAGTCLELLNAIQMGHSVFELTALTPTDANEPTRWIMGEIIDRQELHYMLVDCVDPILNRNAKEVGVTRSDRSNPPVLKLVAKDAAPEEWESVCQEAERIINGDRQADYGHPLYDFTRTGRMWGAILSTPDIPADYVALCMAALKISRQCNKPKRDNIVDAVGYLGTIEKIQRKLAELATQQGQQTQKAS